MIKAVIFDLWDTLIYADMDNPQFKAQKLLGFGNKPYEDFRALFQQAFMTQEFQSLGDAFANACKKFQIEDRGIQEELVSIWEYQRTRVKIYPDSIETLKKFRSKYKLGLLSNASVDTKWVLDDIGISGYFDAIVLSCMTGTVKPDAGIYREALSKLGIDAREALMVGDSYTDDIEGAKKADIKGILLDRFQRYPQYPNRIISLKEIERFLH